MSVDGQCLVEIESSQNMGEVGIQGLLKVTVTWTDTGTHGYRERVLEVEGSGEILNLALLLLMCFIRCLVSCLEKGGECALQINNVILVTNCCTETPTVEWAFPPGGKVSEREEGSFWADVGPALFLPNIQLTHEPTLCSPGHQGGGCLYFLRFLFIFSSSDTYLLSVHYSLMNDLSPQQRFIEHLCYHVSY